MENESTPEQRALMTKVIEASNYIHKNTKRGRASHVLVNEVDVIAYAEKKGMTITEAIVHLDKYFKGETSEF